MEKADDVLIDVLFQVCGEEGGIIDNMCMSAYEHACEYLFKKKLIGKKNDRIYYLINKNISSNDNEKEGENENI